MDEIQRLKDLQRGMTSSRERAPPSHELTHESHRLFTNKRVQGRGGGTMDIIPHIVCCCLSAVEQNRSDKRERIVGCGLCVQSTTLWNTEAERHSSISPEPSVVRRTSFAETLPHVAC